MKKIFFIGCFILAGCQIFSYSPKHNLVVSVFMGQKMTGAVIQRAGLSCSDKTVRDGDYEATIENTAPSTWCDIPALNTPATADQNGQVDLLFNLDPDPNSPSVHLEPEPSPDNDTPMLYFFLKDKIHMLGVENRENSHWYAEATF